MNSQKKLIINIMLAVVFTIIGLYFALKDNYQDVFATIASIKWWQLLIIVTWGIAYYCIGGISIMVLARIFKKNYTLYQGCQNSIIGGAFSAITPSSSGGQFAQAGVAKKQGLNNYETISVLWLDFIIYQLVLVTIVGILLFLRIKYYVEAYSAFFVIVLIGFLINLFIIVILWSTAQFPRLYVMIVKPFIMLIGKIKIGKFKIIKDPVATCEKFNGNMGRFSEQIKLMKNHKKTIFISILANIVRFILIYTFPFFIGIFLGYNIGLGHLIDVMALSSFVVISSSFIPIPGASGAVENLFVSMFSTLYPTNIAGGMMLLWRFGTFHFVIIVGMIMYIRLKYKYHTSAYK